MKDNTMTNRDSHSNIERVVMRRVHRMRFLRIVFSNNTIAFAILFIALWGIGREVWVARVFQNSPKNIFDLPNFYMAAFDHTRHIVQVLTLLTLASLIYFARATAQFLSNSILNRTATNA